MKQIIAKDESNFTPEKKNLSDWTYQEIVDSGYDVATLEVIHEHIENFHEYLLSIHPDLPLVANEVDKLLEWAYGDLKEAIDELTERAESGHSNIAAASGHGSGFPSPDDYDFPENADGYEDPEDYDDYWDNEDDPEDEYGNTVYFDLDD
jgi:hypothetical protein